MNIEIRPVNPETDDTDIARIWSAVNGRLTTAAMLREWHKEPLPEGYQLYRAVGLNAAHEIIGYILIVRQANDQAGRFALTVMVDPAHRRQGIGTQLYEHAQQQAKRMGATSFSSMALESQPEALRFAEQRGFFIDRKTFASTIDLHTFDESRFSGLIESVEASGIRFFTLADVGDTEVARRKLHHVNFAVARDDPGAVHDYIQFDQFNEMFNTASWFRPEGQILAADGDEYVGLAAIGYFVDTNSTYNMITGVMPRYRGRKIAQALKLLTIRYSKTTGADYIRTHNDSQNAPMLAINRKLGYQPGEITLELTKH